MTKTGRPKIYGETAASAADRQRAFRSNPDRKRLDVTLSEPAYGVLKAMAVASNSSVSETLEVLIRTSPVYPVVEQTPVSVERQASVPPAKKLHKSKGFSQASIDSTQDFFARRARKLSGESS